jgi:hypothetical protein
VAAQGGTGAYTYAWAFGDGQTSALADPMHVYTAAGDYTPSVQVTSGAESVPCATRVSVMAAPPQTHPLTVSRQGTGSGVVVSNPAGIDCGSTCAAAYPQGTPVTLSATADPGSAFVGWSGACAGAGACVVTMDAARAVSARFDLRSYTLSITKTPVGSILGSVTSSPAGINCGLLCASATASFPSGTVVTLSAQAAVLASFTGWRGDCSGSGSCVLTMDADKSAIADFSLLGLGTGQAAGEERHVLGEAEGQLALLRSTLGLRGGRGEVALNGRSVLVTGAGEAIVGIRTRNGENLVEAYVRQDDGGGGLWRFDLLHGGLEPGSLRVLSGQATAVGADAVTFRTGGRGGERLAFAFRARAPSAR